MSVPDDLKAYLDGELPPLRMAEIRDAIDADPALAEEVEQLRTLSTSLQAFAARPTVVGLEDTLSALGRSKRRKSWFVRYAFPLATAAAAIILAAVVAPKMRFAAQADSSARTVAFRLQQKAETRVDAAASSSLEVPRVAKAKAMPTKPMIEAAKPTSAIQSKRAEEDSSESVKVKDGKLDQESLRGANLEDFRKSPEARTQQRTRKAAALDTPKERPEIGGPDKGNALARSSASVAGTLSIGQEPSDQVVVEVDSLEQAEIAARVIKNQVNGLNDASNAQAYEAKPRLKDSDRVLSNRTDSIMPAPAKSANPFERQSQDNQPAPQSTSDRRQISLDIRAEDAQRVKQLAVDTVKTLQSSTQMGFAPGAARGESNGKEAGNNPALGGLGGGGFGGGGGTNAGMGGGMMGPVGGPGDRSPAHAMPPGSPAAAQSAPTVSKRGGAANEAKAPVVRANANLSKKLKVGRDVNGRELKEERKRIVIIFRIRPKVGAAGTTPPPTADPKPPAKSP